MTRGTLGLDKRSARRLDPQVPHRDPRDREFVGSPQSRRQGRGIELRQRAFGLVEAPDQQKTANLEMPRVRGVRPVAVPLERRPRSIERLGGPAQVARDECNLGFGNNAPRAGHRLFRAKGARRPSQQSLRSNEVADLGHRDASKRQSRRIITQSDPLQCAQGVARCQCMRCSSDQRVHRNPAKLVTPVVPTSGVRSVCGSTTRNGETDMPDILHKVGIKSSSLDNVYRALATVEGPQQQKDKSAVLDLLIRDLRWIFHRELLGSRLREASTIIRAALFATGQA
jgi:hypothetical protein